MTISYGVGPDITIYNHGTYADTKTAGGSVDKNTTANTKTVDNNGVVTYGPIELKQVNVIDKKINLVPETLTTGDMTLLSDILKDMYLYSDGTLIVDIDPSFNL